MAENEQIEKTEKVLEVVDSEGKVRATLGIQEYGDLKDKDDTSHKALQVEANGSLTLTLSVNEEIGYKGRINLVLFGREGGRAGSIGLSLWDKDEKHRLGLNIEANGRPHLTLSDKDNKFRLILDAQSDESSRLVVLDKDGEEICSTPISWTP